MPRALERGVLQVVISITRGDLSSNILALSSSGFALVSVEMMVSLTYEGHSDENQTETVSQWTRLD